MSRRAALCALLILVAKAAILPASIFVAMSDQQLVRRADAVAQGRVVALESFWSEDGRAIVTEAAVAVDDVIVGDAQSTVVVRTFGGKVDGIRIEAHGFPRFEPDEKVIVFVRADARDGINRVLGYQQGHFRVVTRLDGVTLAVPMVEDAHLFLPSGALAPERRSVEIGAFKSGSRRLAAREGRPVR